jgi:hypothetical protein
LDVTFTLITQTEFGAMVALFNVTNPVPLLAVTVADASQPVSVAETGFARSTFAGRLSMREDCVNVVFGSVFLIEIVNRLTSPTHIVFGEKDLLISGGKTALTRNVALAGVVFVMVPPPPVPVNVPAGMVFIRLPEVIEVTSIETVHEPGTTPTCGGTVPPLNEKEALPAGAITMPSQVLVKFTGFAMKMPG